MKILLIGNYINSQEVSMLIYAEQLSNLLQSKGHEVKIIRPNPILGKIVNSPKGLGKWLGYIDKYILFINTLIKESKKVDIVHICDHSNAVYTQFLKNVPYIVTCHDVFAIKSALGLIERNKVSSSGKVLQKWILNGLKRSQNIVCVSNNTKNELESIINVNNKNISVIYNSLNYDYKLIEKNTLNIRLQNLSLDPKEEYFFHLGGNHWYKNRIGVIKIFYYLQKKPLFKHCKLILAGVDWTVEMKDLVKKLDLRDKVIKIIKPTNDEINTLYSGSNAFLFPSLAEGFGWPIIEAQASGALVITNFKEPMSEVGSDSVIYINPELEKESADIIEREIEFKNKFIEKGKQNILRFSSNEIIKQYEAIYKKIIEGEIK